MNKINFTFSHRILSNFLIMAILSILIGYFAFTTMRSLQKTSRAIMKENVSSLKAAEELELALLNQKGLVSSYFLDGNITGLKTLEQKKQDFNVWFKNAQDVALTSSEEKILQDISVLYRVYDNQRNRAIRLYQSGNIAEAQKVLLNDMKNSTEAVYGKCEDLIMVNEMLIAKAELFSQKNVFRMTILILVMIITTLFLGGIMGFLTARKINTELIRSAKMASLGQLSASVAHEIRNPLTSIKMRLYTLQSVLKEQPEFRDDMAVIDEEIDRLERTVTNFLNFGRLPRLNLQPCSIGQVLESVINLLEPKAHSQNIQIQKNIDCGLPELKIDIEQIRQAFLNIILNAIEAMPQGGILEIETLTKNHAKKSNGILELRIKDSGKGVDPVLKNRLFEPFVTTKEQGTGLGLFITSKIVKMHKGDIKIESLLEKGTTVIVKLPIFANDNNKKNISKVS